MLRFSSCRDNCRIAGVPSRQSWSADHSGGLVLRDAVPLEVAGPAISIPFHRRGRTGAGAVRRDSTGQVSTLRRASQAPVCLDRAYNSKSNAIVEPYGLLT